MLKELRKMRKVVAYGTYMKADESRGYVSKRLSMDGCSDQTEGGVDLRGTESETCFSGI